MLNSTLPITPSITNCSTTILKGLETIEQISGGRSSKTTLKVTPKLEDVPVKRIVVVSQASNEETRKVVDYIEKDQLMNKYFSIPGKDKA